ncbi:uncharacterized protein N7498_002552 [Penicillium cinerascens]|uniref:Metallo-beta-lactamase domain-containing protein n=1 Tax=Penicillium cinerascens TaxID=70096 RepID=A0A9W9NA75_9EURO|nr:uncharacterized protein N7498_002552 [Penicillium cinerascens]KAJ5216145.1 hypothetical protein N7498_002552 [Penicillium cinerascens]
MKSLQSITQGVQRALPARWMQSAAIPSAVGHNSMRGNNAAFSQASPRRALSSSKVLAPAYKLRPQGISSSRQRPPQGQALYTTSTAKQPTIHNIYEKVTGTWQYIVADPSTSAAAIIDPVLNYDPATQAITTQSADELLSLVQEKRYKIEKILETHAHADHLTASAYLQSRLAQIQNFKPPIAIGKRIDQVQKLFGKRYGLDEDEYTNVFNKLFDDDETFSIGNLTAKAIHLPGHTVDHLGYQIGDNVFCGDSLFHADIGTARCDFPGGDATQLFQSARKLLELEDHVKIWPGHDYPPEGREPTPWMSVQDQKKLNKHLRDAISQEEFVAMRNERDKGLNAPRLLHQSLQVNIRAGRLPKAHEGLRMLRLPLKLGKLEW